MKSVFETLKSLNKEEIEEYLKKHGSVVVENNHHFLTVEHFYPNICKKIKLIESSENNGADFKLIDDKFFYLKYLLPSTKNIGYHLSIDYDQKDIYEHSTYDKFCRNNLKFKSGNFQLITSYLLPFKKMTRTRMFFLRKKIKAGKKNFYEYFVALPKNFDKNKKYDCLITTDGILWMRFLRLDDLIQNELKLNMIVVGILQKDQNKELAYNMYFAEFIVNTFSKKLKEEYKIKDMIFFGNSFGALCGLNVACFSKNPFKYIICQSPSFYLDNKENYGRNFQQYITLPLYGNIIISYGNCEQNEIMQKPISNFKKKVKYKKLSFHTFFGGHDYLSWRDDLKENLKKIYNTKKEK